MQMEMSRGMNECMEQGGSDEELMGDVARSVTGHDADALSRVEACQRLMKLCERSSYKTTRLLLVTNS